MGANEIFLRAIYPYDYYKDYAGKFGYDYILTNVKEDLLKLYSYLDKIHRGEEISKDELSELLGAVSYDIVPLSYIFANGQEKIKDREKELSNRECDLVSAMRDGTIAIRIDEDGRKEYFLREECE